MLTSRVLLLAFIALTAAAGLMTRFASGWSNVINIAVTLERSPPATGAILGKFRLEGFDASFGSSMRLSSSKCDTLVLMQLIPISLAPPEVVYAAAYPRDRWKTSFVYMHSSSEAFPQVRLYAEYLIYGFWSRLVGSVRDAAEGAYVVFHAPSECELSPSDMVDAADALIAFAKRS